jgi:hypothetical protein
MRIEGFIPPGYAYGDGTAHVSSLSFLYSVFVVSVLGQDAQLSNHAFNLHLNTPYIFVVSVLGQDAQLSNHAFNLHLNTPYIFLLFQDSHGRLMVPDSYAEELGYHGAQAQ